MAIFTDSDESDFAQPTTTAKSNKRGRTVKSKPQVIDNSDGNSDSDANNFNDDESDFEIQEVAPKKKTKVSSKATTASRKNASSGDTSSENLPLQPVEDSSINGDLANGQPPQTGASSQYQKLSQLEHILKRPDTYIGSIERTESMQWVYDNEEKSMAHRNVSLVPGLFKIFDEILVNAADNKTRDASMNLLEVTIDPESNTISVYNNGKGIPIEIHTKEKMYIPELIFGNLLTSSNYDDDQKKVTGGRNGFGAKVCLSNILPRFHPYN